MASDPINRSAARTATFVAVPVAVAVLGISALLFGGFGGGEPDPAATGPVTMTARELTPEDTVACQGLISDLPTSVASRAQRPVTEGAEQNAAYGDPPVTLECGTTLPVVGDTDMLFSLVATDEDDQRYAVCWHRVDGDDRTLWTTVDRTVPVTVTVPGPPDGSFLSVSPFSAAVGANLDQRDTDEIPTGCQTDPPIS